MPDLKPITWTNWNWRRRLSSVFFQPKAKVKRKPEAWLLAVALLSAIASLAAAVAAGFSAYAAFRQTEAAYRSQLYIRQVDAVSELRSAGDVILEAQTQAFVYYKAHQHNGRLPDKIADLIDSALLAWEVAVRRFDQITPTELGGDVQLISDRMTAKIRERVFDPFDHVDILVTNTQMGYCLQDQLLRGFGLDAPAFRECFGRYTTRQLMGLDK